MMGALRAKWVGSLGKWKFRDLLVYQATWRYKSDESGLPFLAPGRGGSYEWYWDVTMTAGDGPRYKYQQVRLPRISRGKRCAHTGRSSCNHLKLFSQLSPLKVSGWLYRFHLGST